MIVQWVLHGSSRETAELYFNARELAAFLRDDCGNEEAARIVEETIALTEQRIES